MTLKDMAHMTYKFMVRGYNPPESSTATRWVAATNEQYVGYASNSARTSWTWYDRINDGHPVAYDIAYGKDGSGNGIYVVTNSSSTKEVSVSSTDVTDGNAWTHVNFGGSGDYYMAIAWSNDVWMTVGMDGKARRSTDGASSWSTVDLSSLAGFESNDNITSIAGDGNGKWCIAQNENLYHSTDDGANWSRIHQFTGTYTVRGLAYTNSSWVIAYERSTDSGKTFIRSAAASDLTTWSAEGGGGTLQNADVIANTGGTYRTSIAADADGRIVVLPYGRKKIGYADINGTTTPANFAVVNLSGDMPASETLRDVATDGTTWMMVGQDGVLFESTDSGESWSLVADHIYDSSDDVMCITSDVYLPLA